MQRVSVVIASHNKHDYLIRTLACLARQTVRLDEVIVVDDASEPPLEELPSVSLLVRRNGPPHMQAAKNLGIANASGDLILLLDDDCLVRGDWARSHLRRQSLTPGCLVVGSVRRIEFRGEWEFWNLPPAPGVPEHRVFCRACELLGSNVPPWNVAPCSNNASLPRWVLHSICGYDPDYRGWGVDDVDLSYRLLTSGVPLVVDSAPVVYHQEHPRSTLGQRMSEVRNLRRFADKHGFWLYGTPASDWDGPNYFPPGSPAYCAWHVHRPGEPPAIYIHDGSLPEAYAPHVLQRWPLGVANVEPAVGVAFA